MLSEGEQNNIFSWVLPMLHYFIYSKGYKDIYSKFIEECHIYFKGRNCPREETFAVRWESRDIFTFRGNKLSRMTSYEKFRGNKLSRWTTFKIFHRNKKRRKSKFVRRSIRFYCTVLRWGTSVKIAKKEIFKKHVFHYSFFLEFFWNFTTDKIIRYSQKKRCNENSKFDLLWLLWQKKRFGNINKKDAECFFSI